MRKILVVAVACLGGSAYAQWFNTFGTFAIPDDTPAGLNVPITVSGVGTVLTDVNFGAVVQHTWQGDSIFRLTAPGGPSATILVRAGSGGGAGFGYSSDNYGDPANPTNMATWFVLDDQAGTSLYDIPFVATPGIPNVSGSWIPYTGALAVFNGIDPNGVWTANFSDNAFLDTGSVLMAGVQIAAVPEPGTMIALGIGAAALLGRRRRKRA